MTSKPAAKRSSAATKKAPAPAASINTRTAEFRAGDFSGVRLIVPPKFSGRAFALLPNGEIVSFRQCRTINVAKPFEANDAERRTFAKLAGIKAADLQKQITAQRAVQKKLDAAHEADRLRRLATRHGFKLVRAESKA